MPWCILLLTRDTQWTKLIGDYICTILEACWMQTIFSKKRNVRGVNRWLRKTKDVHGYVGFTIYSLLTVFFYIQKHYWDYKIPTRLIFNSSPMLPSSRIEQKFQSAHTLMFTLTKKKMWNTFIQALETLFIYASCYRLGFSF